MTVTWDASTGTAPWTITVAPLGHVPVSVSLPAKYMSGKSWHWTWNVPGYAASVSQVIVAISDSTGRVTGTSTLSTLTKSGSCSAPPEHLDFIWFPPTTNPKQCDDWPITVQEDHGNLGLKMPVDLLILPDRDVPTRLRINDQKHTSLDWMVNYPQGTKFAIASFDAGSSGTGGVGGQAYTVGHGKSTSCIGASPRQALAGLPAASSTASPVAASTAANAPSRMATSRVPTTPTNINAQATPTTQTAATSNNNSSANTGAIAGGVGGIVAALAITGLVVYLYRKRRNDAGPDEYGVFKGNEKRSIFGGLGSGRSAGRSGFTGKAADGRFGASTDQQGGISPFVTGRASPWRYSARPVGLADSQDTAHDNDDRRAILTRFNDHPASSVGHSSSVSLHRGRDSIGGAGPMFGMNGAPSVHSVVPDDALFPPPMPVNRAMMPTHGGSGGNFGAAANKQTWNRDRSDSGSSQRDPFRNPVNAITPPPKDTPLPSTQQQQSRQLPPQDSSRSRQRPGPPLSPTSVYSTAEATRSRDLTSLNANPFGYEQHSNLEDGDLSTMRIPPPAPISTSLFDPYAHASRLYSEDDIAQLNAALNKDERLNAATPTSFTSTASGPRYVDPKESAARFRTLETQLLDERKKVVSKVYDDDQSDDEGGLPYMS